MAYFTAKQVIDKIGNPNLALYKGEGYWYFIYDDKPNSVYGSHSVCVMYLNSTEIERWIDIGKRFAAHMEAGGKDIGFYG